MTRRLLLSYLSLAVLVLLCLEIPLGFVYSRGERERVVNAAADEAESVSAYAALSLAAGGPSGTCPGGWRTAPHGSAASWSSWTTRARRSPPPTR
ncbi:hypothetical protein [Streptomyces sp. SA15]|uniref:hypothetical protein n=1 Tax=Streptomyces sp. SA15 TaxID=934019 RepID=UPI00268378CA